MPHTTVFPNQSVRTLLKGLMDMVTNTPAQAKTCGQDNSQSGVVDKLGTGESPDSIAKSKLALKAKASVQGESSPSTSSSGPAAATEATLATQGEVASRRNS